MRGECAIIGNILEPQILKKHSCIKEWLFVGIELCVPCLETEPQNTSKKEFVDNSEDGFTERS